MTAEGQNKSSISKKSIALPSAGKMLYAFMSVFSLAVILRNSDVAIEYMSRGLRLCAVTVIPSLFPFMVISELIVVSGVGEALGRLLSRPVRTLFGISGVGASSIILGTLCGFPVGAKTAISMYDRGAVSREEAARLMMYCNNPSSAFIISAVGVSLFGSRRFGVALYFITLLTALLIAIFARLISGDISTPTPVSQKDDRHLSVTSFTSAVSSAALGMLTVCAYVVFFSTLIGALGCLLSSLSLPHGVNALIYAIFEISGGVSEASAVASPILAMLLAAFAVGWSGFSVHFQILSLADGRNISFRPYFLAKLIQGVLSMLFTYLYVRFAAPDILNSAKSVSTGGAASVFWGIESGISLPSLIVTSLFIICASATYLSSTKRKKS